VSIPVYSDLIFLFDLPLCLAAMSPTFLPGGVSLETVVGLPACLCRPPPWGCEAATMACPFVIGHSLPLDLSQTFLVPAFMNGFSARPAALTTPIMALQLFGR